MESILGDVLVDALIGDHVSFMHAVSKAPQIEVAIHIDPNVTPLNNLKMMML